MPDLVRIAEITGNTIKSALAPMREQISNMQSIVTGLQAQNAELQAKAAELQAKNTNLCEQVAELRAKAIELQAENIALNKNMPEPVDVVLVAKTAYEMMPKAAPISDIIKQVVEPLQAKITDIEKSIPPATDIADITKQVVELIPKPADGKDGQDGKEGQNGKDGIDSKDGMNGKDAEPVSEKAIADAVAAQFERRFADLTLSWDRQARDEISKAIDKMPAPQDGKDGLPAEAIDITQEGRTITIKVGDTVKQFTIDSIMYHGVWKEGEYEKGDCVTQGGGMWIALEKTTDAPNTSPAWQLAVKKGRDGQDLRDSASKHDKTKGIKL